MRLRYTFNYRRVGQTWLGAPCGDNCASNAGSTTPQETPDKAGNTTSQNTPYNAGSTTPQESMFKGVLRLNEVGYFIVSHLAEETTEDEVVHLLLDEYDTTESIARASVHDVIRYLQSENVLTD